MNRQYVQIELEESDVGGRGPQLDKALDARNWCYLGLCISWAIGALAIAGGSIALVVVGQPHFSLPTAGKEALPLIINIFVTLLNESMGYIHSASLRFSLLQDKKLEFNSNLRLLSHSRESWANSLPSNLIVLFCIVLTYTTPFLVFLGTNSALNEVLGHNDPSQDGEIHLSAIALIFFGGGLVGQALFVTWGLLSTKIPTWSSNPLDVLLACRERGTVQRRPGRCMFSVHDKDKETEPIFPKYRQGPSCSAHREVKWILILLWSLIPLGAVWGVTIFMMIRNGNPNGVQGDSWSFLPTYGRNSTSCGSNKNCTMGTSVLNVGWSYGDTTTGVIGSIFMVAGFQAVITTALHCAELLVNLSRDETIWRRATSPKGTDSNYNSIVAACTSWQTVSLFIFKAAVHWLFGLSVNVSYKLGINMYPPQIFYLTASTLVVALLATYMSIRRPPGPQPAAYGHLQTLSDLIDEWHHCMHWGHKESGNRRSSPPKPAYAGTSSDTSRVSNIDFSQRYGELTGRYSMERPSLNSLNSSQAGARSMGRTSYSSLISNQSGRQLHVGWWDRLWTGATLGWYEPAGTEDRNWQ
jgi:hypothetical protein